MLFLARRLLLIPSLISRVIYLEIHLILQWQVFSNGYLEPARTELFHIYLRQTFKLYVNFGQ